ncbi:uncharacterized protein LOC112340970 isoform X2 [Selaginella moellendorffii]|uniref:uncharacterized protein LOC112340970 isoform X2 n=1 Tax=Selaginella moellendorffii TaxID=88036 RepID=UPI000D1CB444|nr:uncharacterized protein LOC112340970 isoform X2 [Selaginella moellendorffii]|eukprot:XP_024516037.1 uncharacterized protein LOC112340970 isoform X2 [Selaginella moellendorffii]
MEEDPAPRVLLAHTFEHQQLREHVDEVRFTEAVLVSGCEVLEFQRPSACSNVPVLGETYPASFALEIFARIKGESRFWPVCAAFVYASSVSSLDLQVIVTDHLVIRGIYSTVTLVIYGTPVRDLNPTPFIDLPFKSEHPSPVPESPKRDIPRLEHSLQTTEISNLVRRLVRLAPASPKSRAALVTAALSYRKMGRRLDNYDAILSSMAQVAEESNKAENETSVTEVLDTVLTWIRDGLYSGKESEVNNFLTGLAAVQLLCISTHECFNFVLAGGIDVLIKALQMASTVSPVATSLALQALEISSRHAFGCDAVLGWGKRQGQKICYATILLTLVQALSSSVVHLSVQVLHRLRVYELAATFQATIDYLLTDNSSDLGKQDDLFIAAARLLKKLTNVLYLKTDVTFPKHASRFLPMEFEDDGFSLDNPNENVDDYILVILQERRFISSIAAFITLNHDRSKTCMKILTGTLDTVQTLLLSLLSSRSGTFLLSSDPEAARAMTAVLQKRCRDQTPEESNIFCSIQSTLGLKPWNFEKLLETSLSTVDIFQRLQSYVNGSNEYLWCLWKLSLLSRTQIGRRAITTNFQDTKALSTMLEVLDSTTATSEKLLAASYAAETLYVLLSDSTLAVWTAWVKHAAKLKEVISKLKVVEDELSETGLFTIRLHLVADAALIYQDKGAVGLLKFAAFLAGENSNLDGFDVNTVMVDEHDASSLLGKMDGSSGFNDSTIIQLTACMQILASVCGSSLAAALYAEGAVTVVSALLERASFMLQDDFEDDDLAASSILTSVVKLLVPTLLLLSTLFQRLELERRQYHNTKLVMLLLRLHAAISGKSVLVPTYSRESGGVEMRAVLRLLAAVLAFWPIFGWNPVIPPRIFRSYVTGSDLPLNPVETCSSLILLGNLLPLDDNTGSCWDFSVEVTLGTTVIPQVTWHTQTPFKEALLEALAPHYHYFADLIPRLALSTSEILRDLLKHVVVRVSCVDPKLSAAMLRPLLTYIEERTSSAAHSSHADALHVLCCIEFVTELANFPASKVVLLQEGILKILFQALLSFSSFRTDEASNCIRSLLTCLTTICDSKSVLSFEHCLYIISSFKSLLKDLPLEYDFITLMHAFYEFSSHRLGKVAFLKLQLGELTASLENDTDDGTRNNMAERHDEPLLVLSQRLTAALNVEGAHDSTLLEIARAFSVGALRLTAAGKSSLGIGALNTLFGRRTSDDQVALLAISDLMSCLRRKSGEGSGDSKCARQAVHALQVLSRLLQRPLELESLLEKLKAGKLEKQLEVHRSSSTDDFIARGIPAHSMLEKFRDRFSWEVSAEVIGTGTTLRPPKRKPFLMNDLSKRIVRLRTSTTEAPHSARAEHVEKEEISEDAPSAFVQVDEEPGDLETSNDDEGSATIFSTSNAYDGQSPNDLSTGPTSISSGTVPPPSYQVYSQAPLFAPSPQPPFLPTPQQLSQHFHLQHQLSQIQRTPQEGYAGYHRHQGQQAVQTQPQHESWSVLQQILASPESIQDLLRDQTRLTMLLEQHPKLLSLLQERFNFSG